MEIRDIDVPRHDFYQTATHVILSLYIKGYGTPDLKDQVEVTFNHDEVIILLPSLGSGETDKQRIHLRPLYEQIIPEESSARILSTKVELKIAKSSPNTWQRILSDGSTPIQSKSGSSSRPDPASATTPETTPVAKPKLRRNWDKVIDDELKDEDTGSKDANAGGDAALQGFFSKLYADADEDTKRAMIKSYTESGGTSLSTNWAEIQKEKTPIRPPDGMEARRY